MTTIRANRCVRFVRNSGRKVRYRGITRNQIGFAHRCAAINLRRLVNLGLTWDENWTITG